MILSTILDSYNVKVIPMTVKQADMRVTGYIDFHPSHVKYSFAVDLVTGEVEYANNYFKIHNPLMNRDRHYKKLDEFIKHSCRGLYERKHGKIFEEEK